MQPDLDEDRVGATCVQVQAVHITVTPNYLACRRTGRARPPAGAPSAPGVDHRGTHGIAGAPRHSPRPPARPLTEAPPMLRKAMLLALTLAPLTLAPHTLAARLPHRPGRQGLREGQPGRPPA